MNLLKQFSELVENYELTEQQTIFLLENSELLNILSSETLVKIFQKTSDYRLALLIRPLLPPGQRSLD